MKREATFSNLLNQTFSEISENAQLIGIYLAVAIPIGAASFFFQGGDTTIAGVDFGFLIGENLLALGAFAVIVVIAAVLASIVVSFWLYAGMVRGTTTLNFHRFWPWIGIYILSMLGIMFGLVLIIIPGIILAIRWLIVLPLVIEGRIPAMDTFGESWALTSGKSWPILGTAVVLFIIVAILTSILAGGVGLLGGSATIVGAVFSAFSEAISTIVFTAFAIGAYRLLRDDTEEIAEVFS